MTGAVFSYKLRYIVGFRLVEIAISTNQKPTIYRNLYENTGPVLWLTLNPLSPDDALKHHFTSLKTYLIFLQLGVLE